VHFVAPFVAARGIITDVSASTIRTTHSLADLVKDHQADVWRYLRFLGCDASGADDLTQETFLVVLQSSFCYRGHAEAAAYLRKVARSRYLMSQRRRRARPCAGQLEAADEVWVATLHTATGDEFLDQLDECLQRLDGRQRQVIELFYRENRSREEIATILKISPDGVKSLLRRTRALLRQCVERRIER
jgi:RNA polymerase sigma-70 factor (ECF subfamily)